MNTALFESLEDFGCCASGNGWHFSCANCSQFIDCHHDIQQIISFGNKYSNGMKLRFMSSFEYQFVFLYSKYISISIMSTHGIFTKPYLSILSYQINTLSWTSVIPYSLNEDKFSEWSMRCQLQAGCLRCHFEKFSPPYFPCWVFITFSVIVCSDDNDYYLSLRWMSARISLYSFELFVIPTWSSFSPQPALSVHALRMVEDFFLRNHHFYCSREREK